MKLFIISVGKRNDDSLNTAISDYSNRISHTANIDWLIIPPSALAGDIAKSAESKAIIAKLKPNDTVWLCDERGEQISSLALSGKLQALKNTGISRLVIVIGGAYGVNDDLRQKADWVWSLSELVFPHQIVRLLVAEQLYRALQIERGSGYHHA